MLNYFIQKGAQPQDAGASAHRDWRAFGNHPGGKARGSWTRPIRAKASEVYLVEQAHGGRHRRRTSHHGTQRQTWLWTLAAAPTDIAVISLRRHIVLFFPFRAHGRQPDGRSGDELPEAKIQTCWSANELPSRSKWRLDRRIRWKKPLTMEIKGRKPDRRRAPRPLRWTTVKSVRP